MGQAASQGERLEDAFMRTLGLQIQHLAPGEAVVAGVVGGGALKPPWHRAWRIPLCPRR